MKYTHVLTGKEFNDREVRLWYLRCNSIWGNLTGDWDSYPYFEEWLKRSVKRGIIKTEKEAKDDTD